MTQKRAPKPTPPRVTLADRLLAAGQRLRTNETLTAATLRLDFAAKWAQATAVAR